MTLTSADVRVQLTELDAHPPEGLRCLWDEDELSCVERVEDIFPGASLEDLGDWTMCPACRALWHIRCARQLLAVATERHEAIRAGHDPRSNHPSIGAHRGRDRQLSLL